MARGLTGLMQDLSSFWVTLAVTSWFPSLVSSGTSEYTKQVTEGLHRCTTQTRHWEWKDEVTRYNGSLDISCQGMHYKRDVFAYKLKNLNAIMVFAEPELYHTCKKALIFDGPLEGIISRLMKYILNFENRMIYIAVPSAEDCVLPKRYRSRPTDCFAVHGDEVFECKSGVATPVPMITTIITFLMLVNFSLPWNKDMKNYPPPIKVNSNNAFWISNVLTRWNKRSTIIKWVLLSYRFFLFFLFLSHNHFCAF